MSDTARKKRSRKRKRSQKGQLRWVLIAVAGLAIGGGLLWTMGSKLLDGFQQAQLHNQITEVRNKNLSGETVREIHLPSGVSFAIPQDFNGRQITPKGDVNLFSVTHLFSYGTQNAPDRLLLSYGTLSFQGQGGSPLEAVMMHSPASSLLANSDLTNQQVVSDEQGDWNAFPYRDILVSGANNLEARARLLLIEGSLLILEATWTPQSAPRAKSFFESISYKQPASDVAETKVLPEGETDLLKLINVLTDSSVGDWIDFEGGVVSPPQTQAAILSIPIEAPESYEMRLSVQRAFGNESFNVGLPIGDSMGLLVIDGFGGNISGLGTISGASLDQRSDAVTGSFLSLDPSDIVINVTPDSIHVTCNDTILVDWTGDPSTLEVRKQFWKVDEPQLFFGSWESEFVIRSAAIWKR